jgi:hypothetical protein
MVCLRLLDKQDHDYFFADVACCRACLPLINLKVALRVKARHPLLLALRIAQLEANGQ